MATTTPEMNLIRLRILALLIAIAINLSIAPAALAVTAPSFTTSLGALKTGSYRSNLTVTMTAPAGTIYFTTTGQTPDNTSQQYTAPITINGPTQLNAVAYDSGTYSAVTTVYLDVDPDYTILQSEFVMFTVSGTVNTGDVLTLSVFDADIPVQVSPSLPAGQRTFTHTVAGGDTLATIANSLRQKISTDAGCTAANIEADDYVTNTNYFIVSRNFAGDTSFAQSVSPSGNEVLTQSGLDLRLKSSFGLVTDSSAHPKISKWVDLSGFGNDATGTTGSEPTLASVTGISSVNFNGSSQYLTLPAGFANFKRGGTFFMVVRPIAQSGTQQFFDLGNGTASNNVLMNGALVVSPASNSLGLTVYNGGSPNGTSTTSAFTSGQFQLVEGVYLYNQQNVRWGFDICVCPVCCVMREVAA